jgi:hypothetical protein
LEINIALSEKARILIDDEAGNHDLPSPMQSRRFLSGDLHRVIYGVIGAFSSFDSSFNVDGTNKSSSSSFSESEATLLKLSLRIDDSNCCRAGSFASCSSCKQTQSSAGRKPREYVSVHLGENNSGNSSTAVDTKD